MTAHRQPIILLTGATDGLGRLVAQDLAEQGATLLLHGRDPQKGQQAVEEIRQQTGNERVTYYNADLASLAEVRTLGQSVIDDHDRLDVLINNAGVGAGSRHKPVREESRDGHELRFAVNYLSHFLLTHLVLPLLRNAASQAGEARIVNVASIGQAEIDFSNVMLTREYDGMRAYSQSKLAQIMFTMDLANTLEGTGVTVTALHPATLMDTKMVHESFGSAMTTVRQGADSVERLAVSPEMKGVTAGYFDGKRAGRAKAQAYDPDAQRRLRELSRRLTGLD